ncbi:MAG TPA: general secretion pathway protein GspB [Caldimonas sp.]|jgi:general secretion pathway protein B|nr:general secretion pathway protein GspB [Caldimonas sp.]HEV7574559.1 general secretion pathway protein GspB [Caldimonas sp.]
MSYILDALRRAEAERERGAVPSLQSQQHAIADDDARAARPRTLVGAIVALAVALIGVLAWNFLAGPAAPTRAPIEGSISPVPAPLPTLPVAPATLPPAVTTATPTNAPAPPVTTILPTLPSTAAPAPPTATAPTAAIAPPATRTATDLRRAAGKPATAASAAAPTGAPGATTATTGENRVYMQSELPEEIRRDLPKVVVGGSSYSGDAASRMVMINGQVFHEGDRLAPGLVLERIRLKSAVLAFKGWRYEVVF